MRRCAINTANGARDTECDTARHGVHASGQFFLGTRQYMPVNAQGDGRVSALKPLGNIYQRHAMTQQDAGVGVPQAMNADLGQGVVTQRLACGQDSPGERRGSREP